MELMKATKQTHQLCKREGTIGKKVVQQIPNEIIELELTQTSMVQKPMLRVEGKGARAGCACLNRASSHPVVSTTLWPRMRFKTFTLTFGLSLKAFHCSSLIMIFACFAPRGLEHNET